MLATLSLCLTLSAAPAAHAAQEPEPPSKREVKELFEYI